MINPLLSLPFVASLEELGNDYWDVVEAAKFPCTKLCFRNNSILKQLGLNPNTINDHDFEEAYGMFKERAPLLALRYHGYQFGNYNPYLGDGRGFLYGQLHDKYGRLQDLGTKGSGTTPWSRGGDGRLTLKGGVREIIASEVLHKLGIQTSRTLSLIETGEKLWRGDEPSPTRSSVMVRMAHTHLRFGTLERLLYLKKPKLLEKLLRYVIATYYPHIASIHPGDEQYSQKRLEGQVLAFYGELVERTAKLAAGWMAAGFTHGVLNTDNMSLVGESFDYGPFAFIERWDPNFTAAYFDQTGLYSFGRQPTICHNNLELLQEPLSMILPREQMAEKLEGFAHFYQKHYQFCLYRRLGLDANVEKLANCSDFRSSNHDLLQLTLDLLATVPINYGSFFKGLTKQVSKNGLPCESEQLIPSFFDQHSLPRQLWLAWRDSWWSHQHLAITNDPNEEEEIPKRLKHWNLDITPTRSVIESLWQPIEQEDNWEPFQSWLIKNSFN